MLEWIIAPIGWVALEAGIRASCVFYEQGPCFGRFLCSHRRFVCGRIHVSFRNRLFRSSHSLPGDLCGAAGRVLVLRAVLVLGRKLRGRGERLVYFVLEVAVVAHGVGTYHQACPRRSKHRESSVGVHGGAGVDVGAVLRIASDPGTHVSLGWNFPFENASFRSLCLRNRIDRVRRPVSIGWYPNRCGPMQDEIAHQVGRRYGRGGTRGRSTGEDRCTGRCVGGGHNHPYRVRVDGVPETRIRRLGLVCTVWTSADCPLAHACRSFEHECMHVRQIFVWIAKAPGGPPTLVKHTPGRGLPYLLQGHVAIRTLSAPVSRPFASAKGPHAHMFPCFPLSMLRWWRNHHNEPSRMDGSNHPRSDPRSRFPSNFERIPCPMEPERSPVRIGFDRVEPSVSSTVEVAADGEAADRSTCATSALCLPHASQRSEDDR